MHAFHQSYFFKLIIVQDTVAQPEHAAQKRIQNIENAHGTSD
jgi:hypothetical protein